MSESMRIFFIIILFFLMVSIGCIDWLKGIEW